jgi:hypothetical protein
MSRIHRRSAGENPPFKNKHLFGSSRPVNKHRRRVEERASLTPGAGRGIKMESIKSFSVFWPRPPHLLTRCFLLSPHPLLTGSGFSWERLSFDLYPRPNCKSKIHHPYPRFQIFGLFVMHPLFTRLSTSGNHPPHSGPGPSTHPAPDNTLPLHRPIRSRIHPASPAWSRPHPLTRTPASAHTPAARSRQTKRPAPHPPYTGYLPSAQPNGCSVMSGRLFAWPLPTRKYPKWPDRD